MVLIVLRLSSFKDLFILVDALPSCGNIHEQVYLAKLRCLTEVDCPFSVLTAFSQNGVCDADRQL